MANLSIYKQPNKNWLNECFRSEGGMGRRSEGSRVCVKIGPNLDGRRGSLYLRRRRICVSMGELNIGGEICGENVIPKTNDNE
jgi:hypothetical protein